jgi:tryptophan synthase alpha chain
MRRAGLHPIYLVAPTTRTARVHKIARHAGGFIYYVSREGVTGMQKKLAPTVTAHVATIRRHSKLPVAIGFGISNPSQARKAAKAADAVVVGSAIVNQIAKLGSERRTVEKVGRFVAVMVNAVKSV